MIHNYSVFRLVLSSRRRKSRISSGSVVKTCVSVLWSTTFPEWIALILYFFVSWTLGIATLVFAGLWGRRCGGRNVGLGRG